MGSEWKKVRLSEIGKIVTGKTPPTKNKENFGDKYPFITPRDMRGQKYIRYTERYLSDIGFNLLESVAIPPNSICVTCIGSMGKIAMSSELSITNQQINSIIPNDEYDPSFIYYCLKPKEDYFKSISGGTTMPILNKTDFSNIEIEVPPLPEQQKIASILSAFDDKIELNNEMNKTLEEIAQAIFKHWFIDFEFPNENGEPYKSSGGEFVDSELGPIPKGWKVVELRNFVKIIPGYSYRKSDLSSSRYALVTIKNFERGGGFKIDGFKEISNLSKVKEHHYLKKYDLIVAHTDLTQKGEIIGNPVLILTENDYDKLVMSMDVVKVESKHERINNFILYLYLKQERFKKHALGYATGTTVLHLNKNAILDYKIPLSPKYEIYETLSNLLKNMFDKISNNLNENKTLSQLRDTLLPKLISGEIRVM